MTKRPAAPGTGVIAVVDSHGPLSSPASRTSLAKRLGSKQPLKQRPRRHPRPAGVAQPTKEDRQKTGHLPSSSLLLSPLDDNFHPKPSNPKVPAPAAASCRKGRAIARRSRAPSCGFGIAGRNPAPAVRPGPAYLRWPECPPIAVCPAQALHPGESESLHRAECRHNSPALAAGSTVNLDSLEAAGLVTSPEAILNCSGCDLGVTSLSRPLVYQSAP